MIGDRVVERKLVCKVGFHNPIAMFMHHLSDYLVSHDKHTIVDIIGKLNAPHWAFENFCNLNQVTPAAGIIKPDHIAEVSIHLEDFPTLEEFVDGFPQNSWCEDTRDKEAILVVRVQGTYKRTETRNHRIRVRHCCSGLTSGIDPRPNGSGRIQGNVLHRSDYQQLSSSYDVVNHLRNLHSP